MTVWNAAGMKVAYPLRMAPYGCYESALHDLHVVDVVEKLYGWRVDFLHDLYSPIDVVVHVVGVVNF